MMVSTVWRDPEHRTQAGVVYRGDKMDQIVGVDIDTSSKTTACSTRTSSRTSSSTPASSST